VSDATAVEVSVL